MKKKLIRITTVPISLEKLLVGQLGFMKSYYHVIAVSADKKRLEAFGKEQHVEVFSVEMTRKITPFKDVIALFKLVSFLRKEQPFIVHTHTPKAGIIGMLAAKITNVPNRLHTVAGMPLLEATGVKRLVLNFVEKLTYKCATKVYPNSMGLKEIIIKNNFIKPSKLKVLANGSSNGIDTEYFNPQLFSVEKNETLKEELGIQKNDFVFIFVGRIVGDKGINELVKAFRDISRKPEVESQKSNVSAAERSGSQVSVPSFSANNQQPTTKLLLVGPLETELDPLLPETLQEITNNKNIISVGWQQDVRPYFAISDVLVFPSYREGFPNVVMQAGSMELPCIVTNINGCNEIVVEGKNGWIIPVKNTEAIFNAMQNCLINTTAFIKAKSNARKMIETRYEQQMVWETILDEYIQLER